MAKNLFNKPLRPHYEVLIIGGGITGIGVFRDLALHGVSTLLLEKGDFASQTSSRSSKMLHGGIRYLEGLDFSLVHEALHEKNLWLKLTPHLCYEMPFHLPVFRESKYPLWATKMALMTYDALSGMENTPHYILNHEETLREFPELKKDGLTGSGVYYDAVVDDAKLALECLYDALVEPQVQACNYVEVLKVEKFAGFFRVWAQDRLTQQNFEFTTQDLVIAAGPFTDTLMQKLNLVNWTPKLLPTKGIHLWLKEESLKIKSPLVLQTQDDRLIFVIPERNAILVGTTETVTQEDFFNIEATTQEIYYLLETLEHYFPRANFSEEDIISTYAGIRPLVRQEGRNTHKTSRLHKLYRPLHNLHVLVGGKYTTFRTMAQELAQNIVTKHQRCYNPHATKEFLRVPSLVKTFSPQEVGPELVQKIMAEEGARTMQDVTLRRIGHLKHKSKF